MAQYNGRDANQNKRATFDMIEKLGVLEPHKSGWSLEVNIVAWNGYPPKIDIRDWDPDHQRMGRGITLSEQAAVRLAQILSRRLHVGGNAGDASIGSTGAGGQSRDNNRDDRNTDNRSHEQLYAKATELREDDVNLISEERTSGDEKDTVHEQEGGGLIPEAEFTEILCSGDAAEERECVSF